MKKQIMAALLALLLLAGSARSEVCEGVTVAASGISVSLLDGGTLDLVHVEAGQLVGADELLATLRTQRVYAAEDGTVARVDAEAGQELDGPVLELAPISRYTIYCSVDGAYSDPETTRVRVGEALYLRCTADGTHRGRGIVTAIDGAEYTVAATAGEFYVGEVVNLYRGAEFSTSQRVGRGTLVEADVQPYAAEGKLLQLFVQQGEFVERGELLFECAQGGETALTASVSGIVTEVTAPGTTLQPGETAFVIVPIEEIAVELRLDETAAAGLHAGDPAELILASDPTETPIRGTVTSVSQIAQSEFYTVRIHPGQPIPRMGLSVSVRLPV